METAVDTSGNVYVAGYSDATWGTPVLAYSVGWDAFVSVIADPTATTTSVPLFTDTGQLIFILLAGIVSLYFMYKDLRVPVRR